jgi:hypothetical protein
VIPRVDPGNEIVGCPTGTQIQCPPTEALVDLGDTHNTPADVCWAIIANHSRDRPRNWSEPS